MQAKDATIAVSVSRNSRDVMDVLISKGSYASLSEIGREAIYDFLEECLTSSKNCWRDDTANRCSPTIARHDVPAGDLRAGRACETIAVYLPRSARAEMENLRRIGAIASLSDGGRQAIYALLEKIIACNRDRHWTQRRGLEQELGLHR